MTDKFDLEQKILEVWGILDDLKALESAITQSYLSSDDSSIALKGICIIYEQKFDELFKTFENLSNNI